jgi:alkaline phosphatase D
MRIAFASCVCQTVFAKQPVWEWIAAANPDHLLLLGDSMYLDIDAPKPPNKMSDDEFAQHLFARWQAQLVQKQFRALLDQMAQLGKGHVSAIWDDHDFLWDNAAGAAIRLQPTQNTKIPLSNAFFKAFRAALETPGSFPSAYDNAAFWDPKEPAPATPSIELEPGLWLHLSDSRSWRTEVKFVAQAKRQLLGAEQRGKFGKAMAAQPQAVHLIANGSTSKDWKDFSNDWDWLKAQASQRRTLLLSGDVHHNDVDAFYTGGLPLHEATSSGAAVRDAVVVGKEQRNYGLLDITAEALEIRLFKANVQEPLLYRKLSRATWLPV